MKKFLLFLICAFFSCQLLAQRGEIVRIKAGENPATSFSPYGFYRFPAFREGIAFFKDGGRTSARFNYHLLNEEMQFISAAGDTLALADPLSIKYISIDTTLFYYSGGYLEVLENNESLKLARKIRLYTPVDVVAVGAGSTVSAPWGRHRFMTGCAVSGSLLRCHRVVLISMVIRAGTALPSTCLMLRPWWF